MSLPMVKATPKRLSLVDEHLQVYNTHVREEIFLAMGIINSVNKNRIFLKK